MRTGPPMPWAHPAAPSYRASTGIRWSGIRRIPARALSAGGASRDRVETADVREERPAASFREARARPRSALDELLRDLHVRRVLELLQVDAEVALCETEELLE